MADGWETYPVEFRGGLVTNLAPIQQGINMPGSARQLRNFEPSVSGGYRRVSGYAKYAPSALTGAGFIRGVFYYGGKVLAVRNNASGGEGELYESSGGSWTRISTNSIRFTTGNSKIRFAKFNFDGTERVVMVDGTSSPIFLTGSTIAKPTLTSAQAGASHVTVFKDHIFLGKASSIISSAPLRYVDALSWSFGEGASDLQFNDTITGLEVFRDQLYVFSSTKINRLEGNTWSDFKRVPVSTDLGCVEEDTIQEIGGDIVFMGPDGLRLLSGTERIGDVGLGSITKSIQSETTNFQNRNNTFCSLIIREKSQYRVFGYNSSTNATEAQALIGTQFASEGGGQMAWAELRGVQAYSAYSEYTGLDEIYLFGNDTGYVYKLEEGITFDGVDIKATFFTPYLPISDPTIRKTLYIAHTYLDPDGSFNAEMSLNYDFDSAIRADPIVLSNEISSDAPIGLYGTALYATWESDATAVVNGATSNTASVVVDGNSGTIVVGQYVSGSGIVGTPTVITVTDQNNIVLSSVQTLVNDVALSFSDHTTAQTSEIYGNAVRVTLRKQVTGSGFVVSIEYTSEGATQPFTLDALALEYATESRR